jgi:putative aldouronate transport system permease protein
MNTVKESKVLKPRKISSKFFKIKWKDISLLLLTLPMIIFIFVFNYIPMFGVIIAFKRFRFDKGIWGSEWVGFNNFKFFFGTRDAWRITRNTIGYNSVFIIIGLVCAVLFALLLYELSNRTLLKIYQTTMFFPHFLSWVVVAFMAYAFLNSRLGMLNTLFKSLGLQTRDWYIDPKPWILIFPIANLWKGVGMSTLIYYASLMGIDPTYFEAAATEGANKWQIILHIKLPFLFPLMTMLTILAIGSIFNSDFGLFYQLPMNSPMLYETSDVIETYVFRALKDTGNISMSSAAGLYKSFVGFILVITTNFIVRKINSENALF